MNAREHIIAAEKLASKAEREMGDSFAWANCLTAQAQAHATIALAIVAVVTAGAGEVPA